MSLLGEYSKRATFLQRAGLCFKCVTAAPRFSASLPTVLTWRLQFILSVERALVTSLKDQRVIVAWSLR